jgi:molybdopterin-containing oxidoreductase family iron-sulfur binding subunit
MAINVKRCIGCQSCAIACKINNNLPKDIWRNRVLTDGGTYDNTARGSYPNELYKNWYPSACQHCTKPPCLPVCPVSATTIDERGIVVVDNTVCIGCGSCVTACPYEARRLNHSEIEYYTAHTLGDWDAPEHINNTVEKCDFCLHRIERGDMPACMEFCPGNCRHWGDLDDPQSDVSIYLAGKASTLLKEDEGTEPNCHYLIDG